MHLAYRCFIQSFDDLLAGSWSSKSLPKCRGRAFVAYKDHVNDLFELSDEERNAFMADVTRVTRAMDKAFHPEKINYGAYSDKLSHLHFHLVPKYVDGPDYGGVFQMNPGKVYLADAEYQEMIEAIKKNL